MKQELKKRLAEAGKLFYGNGWTPGEDSGDISVRDAETGYIYIFPRPCAMVPVIRNWGMITENDIAVVDPDGNYVEDTHVYATVELPMHLAIYKARRDIHAIVHSHAVWSSAFAVTGQNIPPVLAEQSLFLGGEVVCAEYGKVGSWELANNMVKALGEKRMAALLRNHGAVCCGGDLEQALSYQTFLEKGAQTVVMGKLLGNLLYIRPEDVLDESLNNLPWG
jgi:L-ribulose-5-phosphate 4-epimerase